MEVTDSELLRSAAAGNDKDFHALVDRYSKLLFRTALSLTKNRADAEDVLQETFVGAYRGMKRFDGRSSVKTWLISILYRQAAKGWHKARHSREAIKLDASPEGDWNDSGLATQSETTSVEQRMDLMKCIQSLPEMYREVIVLREIEQLSYEEIAQVLQTPRGTVESRLFRARAELRARLTGYASETKGAE